MNKSLKISSIGRLASGQKIQNSKVQQGFTLIELLAVMVIFMPISIIIAGIIFSAFRGATKTNTINSVRQNGNYALTIMSKMIREAKTIDNAPPCILYPTPTPNYLSSITFTSADGQQTTFACCPGGPNGTIASLSASMNCDTGVNLIDTSAVTLSSCSFTCSRANSTDSPNININFSLKKAGENSFVETMASASAIPFQTTVTLRNLAR